MFFYSHPYKPIIFPNTKTIICGTLPPPRFHFNELKDADVNFPYGSKDNLLWQIFDSIYNLDLKYENSNFAINQRLDFLKKNQFGICDIVESCTKTKLDASDKSMQDIKLRDILGYLKKFPNIDKIFFTGKSSINSPFYFFKKVLKENNIKFEIVENNILKVHKFSFLDRNIFTFSLISPSNAANKAIASNKIYKYKKSLKEDFSIFDFRVFEYKKALEFKI